MPTLEWLKNEFGYGYDSGDVNSTTPDTQRKQEEAKIGGSYKEIAEKLLISNVSTSNNVLELGPGRGSWSKVILNSLGQDGTLSTLDFQDVSKWLDNETYGKKLINYQIDSNNYEFLSDNHFDFFWSFGVLCHNNIDVIYQIFHNIYPKLKQGALLIHQYSDWDKLNNYGWDKGGIPPEFKNQRDDQIWWPRNNKITMKTLLESNGYEIIDIDCSLVERDSIFISRKK